jgi:hypothetical protein
MKLGKDQDNKRGCLLKVFAKNFTSVLESIIIMLGNKLVDWGIDLLRTLLQPVKSALIAAAGSVPFAGGVLATIVDIGWELLMNFGAKMLLKGFVVSQLPDWLQIKKLAALPLEELANNPIVSTVMGIIVQLIESAANYGDKSLAAVGAATVLTGIQEALLRVKPQPDFWIRALTYAKKELAKDNSAGDSILEAARVIAKALIQGFGEAVGRRLSGDTRTSFDTALRDLTENTLSSAGINTLLGNLTSRPIETVTELLANKIGPLVMPIVSSFVNVPDWAREMLNRLGAKLSATLEDIRQSRVDGAKIVGRVVEVLAPAGKLLLQGLPFGDESLKAMLVGAYDKLTDALSEANIGQLKARYLDQPWNIVKGVVDVAGDFLVSKLSDLIQDSRLAPEKTLLESSVRKMLDVLRDDALRGRIFGRTVNVDEILSQLADIVKPYASARLRALLAGTGLEDLAVDASDALFGADGPFKRGAAFFTSLESTLRTQGAAIASRALAAVSGILRAQVDRAGGGPILSGLVQGVLGAVSRGMSSPQTLTAGPSAILGLVRDAFSPLLDALAPAAPPAGAAASPLTSLLRGVLGGVLDLFGNATSLQQLVQRPLEALGSLAGRVATGLKDAVKSVVSGAIPDEGLRGLAGQAVDGFFGLLSDPTRVTSLRGDQVADLVKDLGVALFRLVKTRVVTAVGGAVTGPASEPVRGIVSAVLDEVERILGDPTRLRTLLAGGARELLATIARIATPPLQQLVGALAPAPLRDTLRGVVGDLLGALANPAQLSSLSANDLLTRAAPVLQRVLEGILRAAVPTGAFAAVQTALTAIQSALANPAGLAAAAGQAARQAIEQTIGAALVQISDPGLRELASELVSFVSDLVSSDSARNQIRSSVTALLGRLARAGGRYLTSLLPAGPVQQLAQQAVDGLQGLFSNTGGLAAALGQQAQALLPGAVSALSGVVRDAIQRALPDAPVATLLSGVVDEVLGVVADRTRWEQLRTNGVGYVVSRLFPLARDFATAMLGRLSGDAGGVLRTVVQSLLESAGRLLATPEAVAQFAQNAVSSLVSMGVGALKAAVVDIIQRATGNADVAAFVRSTLDQLSEVLANPSRLQTFLRSTAQQAMTALLDPAKQLIGRLVDGVIRDTGLRALARQGLDGVLEVVQRAISGGNVGDAAKEVMARLIPAAASLAKDKLVELIPSNLDALKQLISRAFDRVATFGAQLLRTGRAAWDTLTGGGRIFGDIVDAILPMVKQPLERAVGWAPLRGLLTSLVDQVGEMLRDPAALTTAFASPRTALTFLLPKLERILGPFAETALVTPMPAGLPKDIVGQVLGAARGLLREPARLLSYLEARDPKQVVKCVVDDLKPRLLGTLPDALQGLLGSGLDLVVKQVLGEGVRCPTTAAAAR